MKGFIGITNALIRANDLPPTAVKDNSRAGTGTPFHIPVASVHLLPKNTVFSILQHQLLPAHPQEGEKGTPPHPAVAWRDYHPPHTTPIVTIFHFHCPKYVQTKEQHWVSMGHSRGAGTQDTRDASWVETHRVKCQVISAPRDGLLSIQLHLVWCTVSHTLSLRTVYSWRGK